MLQADHMHSLVIKRATVMSNDIQKGWQKGWLRVGAAAMLSKSRLRVGAAAMLSKSRFYSTIVPKQIGRVA